MAKQDNQTNQKSWLNRLGDYWPFLSVGAIFLLISIIFFLTEKEIPAYILSTIGASVLVVLIVEIIWRARGGDPMTKAITSLWQATNVLKDIEKSGIKSIKIKRSYLDNEEQTRLWCDLMIHAAHIDLMGFSLRTQISKEPGLMEAIENAVQKNGCRVRVITYPPFEDISKCNPLLLQRINEENRIGVSGDSEERLKSFLKTTWGKFGELKDIFKNQPDRKDCVQIKASSQINLYHNIIRIDDRMWMSHYSSVERGGGNPVFEISGVHSALFQHYEAEFNHMWKYAQDVEL